MRKPNSVVHQRIHSSAQVLRCAAIRARHWQNSMRKSRSLETSRLFAAGSAVFGYRTARIVAEARAAEAAEAEAVAAALAADPTA